MLSTISTAFSKTRDVVVMFTYVPCFALSIAVDRYVFTGQRSLSGLPRNSTDICDHPEVILDLLKQSHRNDITGLGPSSEFVSFTRQGGSDSEPDKNASVVKGVLAFRPDPSANKDTIISLPIFIKMSTARKVSVLLKAIGAAFMSEQKEVGVHTRLIPQLALEFPFEENKRDVLCDNNVTLEPNLRFQVPLCLYGGWNRWCDRACLIFKQVDTAQTSTTPQREQWRSIPDWQGVTPQQLLLQLSQAASLHAATWHGETRAVDFFKEREGVAWLDGIVGLFASHLTPDAAAVWAGLKRALASSDMCCSHGDCRPGNMLFRGDATQRSDVIMTDWEACSITPFMWDCSYSMICGLPTTVRRENEEHIIRSYLAHLGDEFTQLSQARKKSGVEEKENESFYRPPSFEVAQKMCRHLYAVVYFFGWILAKTGGVGETQGNTTNDVQVWRDRVREGLRDAWPDDALASKELGISESVLCKFRSAAIESLD